MEAFLVSPLTRHPLILATETCENIAHKGSCTNLIETVPQPFFSLLCMEHLSNQLAVLPNQPKPNYPRRQGSVAPPAAPREKGLWGCGFNVAKLTQPKYNKW